ncbi:hypothetical protein [Streptomyces rubradiris]|uniref:hypothetical protein n=1 Tax=Streptomyces rubradiris TaxID=285531 RepID=UPI001676DA80|nr:hypothetical protein [Streptomyces rubradiris]
MNLYRFRWAPGIALLAQTPADSDGVKIRTWSTIGLPPGFGGRSLSGCGRR